VDKAKKKGKENSPSNLKIQNNKVSLPFGQLGFETKMISW